MPIVVGLCYVTHHHSYQGQVTGEDGCAHTRTLRVSAVERNCIGGGSTLSGSTVSLSPLVPRRETYLGEGTQGRKHIHIMPDQRACLLKSSTGYPQTT